MLLLSIKTILSLDLYSSYISPILSFRYSDIKVGQPHKYYDKIMSYILIYIIKHDKKINSLIFYRA